MPYVMALVESDIDLYNTRQGHLHMNTEFIWFFKSMLETIKANDGTPWIHTKLYDLYLQEAIYAHTSITDMVDAMSETRIQ